MSAITDRTATRAALQSQLHAHCILCGLDHPQGFRLVFNTHTDGRVEAKFPCDRLYQGYTGFLHGGIIAALMDSAMTHCLFSHGRVAVTGELRVRFLKPVMVNRPMIVGARMAESSPPLFLMESDVRQNRDTVATATAKFVEARISDSEIVPEVAVGWTKRSEELTKQTERSQRWEPKAERFST